MVMAPLMARLICISLGAFLAFSEDAALTEPTPKYLLSTDEMEACRFASPRQDLLHSSRDNEVTYLPNGDIFMARLYDVLTATQSGDFVYATFWQLTNQVILKPVEGNDTVANQTNEERRLINVLGAAVARNVTIRLLVSEGTIADKMGLPEQCEMVNEKCGPGTCVMDNRHGHSNLGSNHEKMWMVRSGQDLISFTGSMDIAACRWDTAAHDIHDPRWQKQPRDPVSGYAWHGTMYEIHGTAAEDIYKTFVARWNDPVAPASGAVPPLDLWLPSQQPSFPGYPGKLLMQVVRTFGCQGAHDSKLYQAFAPHGEYSYAAMWFKALRRAQKYVIVADQFMWFDEAMEAVIEAAERVDFVFIITNNQKHDIALPFGLKIDPSTYARAFQFWQHKAVTEALAKRDSTGKLAQKVHMFNLIKEGLKDNKTSNQIYDHEKTLLIDDEFALVGSTGVEKVGFTNDAELSVAIESNEFATELRRRMLAEFLMLKSEDTVLATPASSHDEFLRQANTGTQRVRYFTPAGNLTIAERSLSEVIYRFTEPDGRCTEGKMPLQWQAVLDAGTDRVKEDLQKMRQPLEVLV